MFTDESSRIMFLWRQTPDLRDDNRSCVQDALQEVRPMRRDIKIHRSDSFENFFVW